MCTYNRYEGNGTVDLGRHIYMMHNVKHSLQQVWTGPHICTEKTSVIVQRKQHIIMFYCCGISQRASLLVPGDRSLSCVWDCALLDGDGWFPGKFKHHWRISLQTLCCLVVTWFLRSSSSCFRLFLLRCSTGEPFLWGNSLLPCRSQNSMVALACTSRWTTSSCKHVICSLERKQLLSPVSIWRLDRASGVMTRWSHQHFLTQCSRLPSL